SPVDASTEDCMIADDDDPFGPAPAIERAPAPRKQAPTVQPPQPSTRPAPTGPITFVVPGQAVGKGRPRIGKRGSFSMLFTPEKTVNYEGLVRLAAHQAMAGRAM